ncbi:CvpA family protein [Actibacterium sp. 188UL27-1]|uniref:CvpA family protein n=1 Tax=Actibacterium sp. 188UL27-1 TaxID=2786961 RepID=UPI00195D42CE|nr:CvpA family protein [Actibacterium sp. 188UL27-1]MBM7067861.1 CvpA family protein [Actibacterium sp. 188UL27-1]
MEFTIFDAGVAVVIVLSAILAYSRGLVRETLAIAGWVAAAIVAYLFAPRAEPIVQEIPYVQDLLDNCQTSTIGAFIGLFALCLIVFALFTPLFSSLVQRSALGGLDQGLGFLFGAARGLLLVAIALVVYDFVAGTQNFEIVDNSQSAKIFASFSEQLTTEIADRETALAWLTGKFEGLMDASCGAPATTTDS